MNYYYDRYILPICNKIKDKGMVKFKKPTVVTYSHYLRRPYNTWIKSIQFFPMTDKLLNMPADELDDWNNYCEEVKKYSGRYSEWIYDKNENVIGFLTVYINNGETVKTKWWGKEWLILLKRLKQQL